MSNNYFFALFAALYQSCSKIPKEGLSRSEDLMIFKNKSYPLRYYEVINERIKSVFFEESFRTDFELYRYVEDWDQSAISQIFDTPLHAVLGGYVSSNGQSSKTKSGLNPITFFLWYLIFARLSVDLVASIQGDTRVLAVKTNIRDILSNVLQTFKANDNQNLVEVSRQFKSILFFPNSETDEENMKTDHYLESFLIGIREDAFFLEKYLILSFLDPRFLVRTS